MLSPSPCHANASRTSASFYHASFADIYKHDFLQPARDLVEETRNCEDVSLLAISCTVGQSRSAPLTVHDASQPTLRP